MRIRHRVFGCIFAFCGFAMVTGISLGQPTVIFDSKGFESPTYTAKAINGQQSFKVLPNDPNSGIIQAATVRTGSQAFQANGPAMTVPGFAGTGANFWFKDTFTHVPTALNPYVQVKFSARLNSAPLIGAMPAAGVYLEGDDVNGDRQGLVQIELLGDGSLGASSNASTGDLFVTSINTSFPLDNWHDLFAELNFTTQSYRIYRAGNPTPIEFLTAFGETITEIPFRNTNNANTAEVNEIGMLAFNFNLFGEAAPTSSAFIDDFVVTGSADSQVPVPEPGLMLAVGAAALGGLHAIRRRRAAKGNAAVAASG
jgi:hypothetical protein